MRRRKQLVQKEKKGNFVEKDILPSGSEREADEKSYLKIVSFEWLKSKSSNVLKYLKLEEFVNNVIWHQS